MAIAPVVLFHAGWTALPGGFVGVDIFFVISGYLITRILYSEMSEGTFSLWRFYERRARRIMPALFVVLAVSSIIALGVLLPDDLVRFALSLIYTVLFASNVYFFARTGYFEASADSYALLHTWSLAVEEQFYLVYPLVLLPLLRLGRKWTVLIIALIGAASLAASIVMSPIKADFAFYLPLTRAWELIAGALLALGAAPQVTQRWIREGMTLVALAAIAATVLLVDKEMPFPGWVAILPVLGTAILLQYAPGTLAGRILSTRPAVAIGLISYSLYLWHWPLLSFAQRWMMRPLEAWEGTTIVLLAVGLAALSWRFVEQPFRRGTFMSRRQILAATVAGIALFAAAGTATLFYGGLPQRVPAAARMLADAARDIKENDGCSDFRGRLSVEDACAFGADTPPTVAVWADSHGVMLSYGMGLAAGDAGVSVLQLTSSACPPSLDFNPSNRPECAERNDAVLTYLEQHPTITTVVLAASRGNNSVGYLRRIRTGTEELIERLQASGKQIVLIKPYPRDNRPVPEKLALQQWYYGRIDPHIYPIETYRERFSNVLAMLDDLAEEYGLETVDPTPIFCPQGECVNYRDGKVMFADLHHPTLDAINMLVATDQMQRVITGAAR